MTARLRGQSRAHAAARLGEATHEVLARDISLCAAAASAPIDAIFVLMPQIAKYSPVTDRLAGKLSIGLYCFSLPVLSPVEHLHTSGGPTYVAGLIAEIVVNSVDSAPVSGVLSDFSQNIIDEANWVSGPGLIDADPPPTVKPEGGVARIGTSTADTLPQPVKRRPAQSVRMVGSTSLQLGQAASARGRLPTPQAVHRDDCLRTAIATAEIGSAPFGAESFLHRNQPAETLPRYVYAAHRNPLDLVRRMRSIRNKDD